MSHLGETWRKKKKHGLTSDISEESGSRDLSHSILSIHTCARTLPEMKENHWILEEAIETRFNVFCLSTSCDNNIDLCVFVCVCECMSSTFTAYVPGVQHV